MLYLDTNSKFVLCFLIPDKNLTEVIQDESIYIDNKINVEAFKKFMIKNDMEEYTNLLLSRLFIRRLTAKRRIQKQTRNTEEALKYKKDLIEALIFLFSKEEIEISSVSLQRSRESYRIQNKSINKTITEALIENFKKNEFNEVNLTNEEAEQEIRWNCDREWINNWKTEFISYQSLADLEFVDLTDIDNFICDEMIEQYASEHYTKREIDLELLEQVLESITPRNKLKPGAKSKNTILAIECKQLSNLKRLDKFLNQNEITDFNEFPLKSVDCRFIHDCLAFFELIEDYSNKTNTTTTPEKYIRTLLRQTKIEPWNNRYDVVVKNITQLKAKLNTKVDE